MESQCLSQPVFTLRLYEHKKFKKKFRRILDYISVTTLRGTPT